MPVELPQNARRLRRLTGVGRLTIRLILALITLAVLASPFMVAFYISYRARWIGPQLTTPAPRISLTQMSQFRRARATDVHDARAAPIILAYHDISWNSISRYSVTPRAFAAQMAMLHAAGYRTLTARQIVRYLHGGSVPSPSVAITFDDGARGLWTYADKILQRYSFHAISFVITGRVGTHQPYYLTWQEIELMYASGRWDFGSHTDNLHQLVPVSGSGRLGDPLTQVTWIRSKRRLETISEFRRRVQHDLLTSIADLREHHLPRPRLFAYPSSESFGAPPYSASAYSNALIHRLFSGAMTNYLDPAVPLSRREATSAIISRLEITRPDSAAWLFGRLREMTSLPAGRLRTLDDASRWVGADGKQPAITINKRQVVFQNGHARWAYAAFAPGETADWDNYRIAAQIGKLDYHANPSATISVRLGSGSELNVRLANHYVEVTLGDIRSRMVAIARDLPAASSHVVAIEVRRRTTVVSVDGKIVMRKHAAPGPSSTGGFALSAFRVSRGYGYPRFRAITCVRLDS